MASLSFFCAQWSVILLSLTYSTAAVMGGLADADFSAIKLSFLEQ
jgi:hypothetical protein